MSGYGERRTFETHPGAGGVESAYLGLPFKSTPCEDWYGFGDNRCPNRYNETGDLETDINSLMIWIGHYSGHGRTGWMVWATNELERKQAELKALSIDDLQEQRLVNIDKIITTLEQQLRDEQKIKAGFHPQHPILSSGRFDTIPQLTALITQKKNKRLN